jgi:hypothetical protein
VRWALPLLVALAVFAGVLLVTPPGFWALPDVLLGWQRGPGLDAAAYALGAAAGLALVSLALIAAALAVIDLLRRAR